jgi:hypothetical protein
MSPVQIIGAILLFAVLPFLAGSLLLSIFYLTEYEESDFDETD